MVLPNQKRIEVAPNVAPLRSGLQRIAPNATERPDTKKPRSARLLGRYRKVTYFNMVPWAGLEPAQPKPLPPQDSVSTNFTTRARDAHSTDFTLRFPALLLRFLKFFEYLRLCFQ